MIRLTGLRRARKPLQVTVGHRTFYVGPGAHDFGRALENLDYDRMTGTPEMKALLYGALTKYRKTAGLPEEIRMMVGLPLASLSGDRAESTVQAVRRWLQKEHKWMADGSEHRVVITQVRITAQPVGALFDYLLTEEGHFHPQRKADFRREVGVISIGFNTVEMLVVRDRTPVEHLTLGETSGVRRLLDLAGHPGYSLGQLDLMLRQGLLDLGEALQIWESEIVGLVERAWGKTWRRFAVVLIVGGGALLLRQLPLRFNGKAYVPESPVLATARGLYKLGLLQQRRGR